jgi:hypothetical protein
MRVEAGKFGHVHAHLAGATSESVEKMALISTFLGSIAVYQAAEKAQVKTDSL